MKKMMMSLLLLFLFLGMANAQEYPGFRVQGRNLYDHLGEKVVLVGVNKMIVWMDISGAQSYSEIAQTGANCVRIVWLTTASAAQLETTIFNCRSENMIPMVELHDATGDWAKLPSLVDYWVRPDVVEVLKRHEEYLLVNIGNEVGQSVSEADYLSGYKNAITRMRNAGINTPLIIDASEYGQGIDMLQAAGPALLEHDPNSNLMFSVHMWWPRSWGYDDQRVIDEITQSVAMELPLIVGEFGHQWDETEGGQIPYHAIIDECTAKGVGWLPWSWGPGNNPQTFLDMTTDGTYAGLQGWGREVAVTYPNSIQNTAVRPASIVQSGANPTPSPEPTPEGNLAQGQPVTASGFEKAGAEPEMAVDGNPFTRWASQTGDPGWITIDLGELTNITRVIVWWEAAYARQYQIQVSDDGDSWTDIHVEYNGDGGTDDLVVSGTGRYVRVYGTQRVDNGWPYSIWEIAVYNDGSVPTPGPETPTPDPDEPTPTPDSATPTPAPGPVDCYGVSAWDASVIYETSGTRVVHNNNLYENRWYSADQNPESYSGEYDVWLLLGNCDDLTPTPETPTPDNGLLGDVNGSGSVDIVDALLTAQYYVGLDSDGFNPDLADVNCDGNVSIVDALLMAQYYVGLIGQFCQ
ncbi:MAG: discoidin domain-containing protein [Spirochaetales bacterium]|nr:discoidin domain-containing protein [Spirochaetales bacterium]